jgi:hypothetical protein
MGRWGWLSIDSVDESLREDDGGGEESVLEMVGSRAHTGREKPFRPGPGADGPSCSLSCLYRQLRCWSVVVVQSFAAAEARAIFIARVRDGKETAYE